MVVSTEKTNEILILWIENPPVNALSQAVRSGLLEALTNVSKDDETKAVVIACKGRTFVAGADIREVGKPPLTPFLPDVIDAVESSDKPIVAAIHGHALGGGLEIALGCHFRIAASKSQLGLPETNIGIIPGAGGTQRLPRLIGPVKAADMICSGKPVKAQKALDLGLVDRLTDDDLTEAAVQFAEQVSGEDLSARRLSNRPQESGSDIIAALDDMKAGIRKKARGAKAPVEALHLIRKTLSMPFEDGRKLERELFLELAPTDEAKALRHIFFAERATGKPPKGSKSREISKVGVIGAGTMGAGIAMTYADAGYAVCLTDISEEFLARGKERVQKTYQSQVKKGRLSQDASDKRQNLVQYSVGHNDLADTDLIVEAAFESMDVKKEIFRSLDNVAKQGAVLATNTSYLDINEIAAVTSRPQDVLGLHYFSPANIMKLVEVVKARETASDALATALSVAKKTGKTAVVSGVCHGFIGNRMLRAYNREAGLLILEGATPAEVDSALTDFGMAMGPFAVADLAGIDIGYKARKEMAPGSFEPKATVVHDRLVEAGHLGQKSGAGFYKYDPETRARSPHPIAEEFLAAARKENDIGPRMVSKEEIVSRTMMALICEGSWILEEEIAERESDIDVVYVHGYGFPRRRGGPMFYGQTLGWPEVVNRVLSYGEGQFGGWWEVSPYLRKRADE